MANNVKDNVVELEGVVIKLNNALDTNIKKLNDGAIAVDNYNKKFSNIPSEFQKSLSDIKIKTDAVTDSSKKLEQQAEKNRLAEIKLAQQREKAFDKYNNQLQKQAIEENKRAEKAKIQELKLQQIREKAFDSYEKQLQKEEQLLQKAEGQYQRIQNSVNILTQTYKNLAIRKELGGNLTIKEEAQLSSLTNRLNMYQNALKKVDATIGNHQREVGNYAKANSNLSNSIGQISRELPNFGQSFSVGVLSLTNNIGALIDGIKQVKAQNAELQSQGKQTKSVFSQILGSLLSWQTALFIGIGIFSAYSKEIGQFVSDLFSASDAIKASERAMIDAYEAKQRYNSANAEGMKNTRKEIDDYLILTAIIKDNTKSYEERINAAKRIKEQYPGYLKNFSEEQILSYQSGKANKELSKTINQLASDIKKRNLAQAQANESTKTFSLIADLREEFKYREAINKQINSRDFSTRELYKKRAKERADLVNDSEDFINKFGEVTIDELGFFSRSEINNLKIRYNALLKEFGIERDAINTKLVETSLLDYKPDREEKIKKDKREKLKLTFDEVESEYNLKLAILERQKAQMNDRASNEDSLFENRIKARKEFSDKSIEILELEVKKEKDLIQEKYLDDLDKNNLAYRNKDISSKQWSKNIQDIQKITTNELATVDMNYSLQWNDLLNENAKFYKDIQDKNLEYTEQTNKLILDGEKAKYEKISNDSKKTLNLRQKAFEQYIELSKKELQVQKLKDIANAKSNEEIILISQKYADAIAKLNEQSAKESPFKKATEATQEYISKLASGQIEKSLESIGLSSAKLFLDFDINGQSTFDKLLEGADKFSEKFAITFQVVGDVAQDVFNKISELSNQRFEQEYNRLAQETEIRKAFAGDSAEAIDEIERQSEEKRKAIARREFQAKKKQALFNIAIDTAQAVMAQLARTPLPLGSGFVLTILGLGALQAGVVASQEMPQFWRGTDNAPEGWALTQERGREIITDKSGKVKSLGSDGGAKYTYLKQGDKVLNADKTMEYMRLNQMIGKTIDNRTQKDNVIIPNFDFSEVVSAIKDKESVSMNIDKKGLNLYFKHGNSIIEKANNRINATRIKA